MTRTCPDCGYPHGPETGVRGELVEEQRPDSPFAHGGDLVRCGVCGATSERAAWEDEDDAGAFVWSGEE